MKVAAPALTTAIAVFQPGALQLYLFSSVVLSGITATILRNPGFRRWRNMCPLPTPASQELWTKVAKGEVPLSAVMDKKGTMIPATEMKAKYLAPTPKATSLLREDIRLVGKLPAHLQAQQAPKIPEGLRDRDEDYDNPPNGFMNKLDWFGRNYKPTYTYRRMRNFVAETTGRNQVIKSVSDSKKEIAKRKAEEYELRRRQRFNRN